MLHIILITLLDSWPSNHLFWQLCLLDAVNQKCIGGVSSLNVVGQKVGVFWIHLYKQSLQQLPGNSYRLYFRICRTWSSACTDFIRNHFRCVLFILFRIFFVAYKWSPRGPKGPLAQRARRALWSLRPSGPGPFIWGPWPTPGPAPVC